MDLIRRAGWGAAEPTKRTPLHTPDGVAVHWNGKHVGSHRHRNCAGLVRAVQRYHMGPKPQGKEWADIAYSLVVCEHGTVFEGRGCGHRTAANGTDDGNDRFYAIMYLGGEGDPLTAAGKQGLRDARRYLMEHGGAGPLARPHSSFQAGHTDCPGDTLRLFIPELVRTTPPPTPPQETDVALSDEDVERVANRVLEVVANGKNRYGLDNLFRLLDSHGKVLQRLEVLVRPPVPPTPPQAVTEPPGPVEGAS